MRKNMAKPTATEIRDRLHYDPETGEFRWRVTDRRAKAGEVAGLIQDLGYRRIGINNRLYGAHQLAWVYMTGEWPPQHLDHIDGVRSNNAWVNLRLATSRQNCRNRRIARNNTTGFKGVRPASSGRFNARICSHGTRIDLGHFDTPEEAHAAYMAKARELFGEFARAA